MKMVPLTLLLAICVVVASTSGVSNLLNVRSSYQRSSVEMNHNGSGDCFEESSVQETMISLGVCLRGCHELHFPSNDEDKEDEYVDIVGANATTTHKSTSSKPRSSTNLIMNTILWFLMLGSGIKLHQLFLIMSILLFTSTLDANVAIGFVAAGFLHLLRGMWGQDSDIDDDDEYYAYYGDGETAFSVELGGRKFTWQEKRSAF